MLDPSAQPLQNSNVVGEEAADEFLILDLSNGRYFGLNLVGRQIWDQLDGSTSLDQIADQVVAHFGIERERALADIQDLLADLNERGLITTNSPP